MWEMLAYVGLVIGLTIVVIALVIETRSLETRLTDVAKRLQESQRQEHGLKRDLSGKAREIADLEEKLQVDHLTGLCNRKGLDDRLKQEVARSERTGSGLGLMFIDADHFKEVNDLLGHHQGDQVLKRLARILADGVRTMEMVARYGGDEFVVILIGADIDMAQAAGERYRLLVENDFAEDEVSTTVSVGVATLQQLETPSAQWLVVAADVAMLQAKTAGRNRVVVWTQNKDEERS